MHAPGYSAHRPVQELELRTDKMRLHPARGRKVFRIFRISYIGTERVACAQSIKVREISKTEETLKALKTRKKELAKVKEQADLQTLYAAIKESGKSVADVISSLK